MRLNEYITGRRYWYHGTSIKLWNKIQDTGYLKPSLSDDEEFGEAVWFTSDREEAEKYGKILLCISNDNMMRFDHKRISPYPIGTIKKFQIKFNKEHPASYDLVILEKIPLKYIEVVK